MFSHLISETAFLWCFASQNAAVAATVAQKLNRRLKLEVGKTMYVIQVEIEHTCAKYNTPKGVILLNESYWYGNI